MNNEQNDNSYQRYSIKFLCRCRCDAHCGNSCMTDDCDCTDCECEKCFENLDQK